VVPTQVGGAIPVGGNAGNGQSGPMPAGDRIQVILEVEPKADPIAGVAVGADGTSRTFCGWTALADAVAAAVDGGEDGLAVHG
jgi:hypothetical protein